MKTNNEKQHWNTAMTNSNEKQQSYYNEKTMRHKNVNTIVQQSYCKRSTMKNQLNTRMKHDNGTQQWKITLKHNNGPQLCQITNYNNENNNETKEWRNNNLTTIVQQWKANEAHQWNTKIIHNNEKQHWSTVMTHSNEKQQSYYNEKQEREENNCATIIQHTYSKEKQWKTKKKQTNQTRQWRTTIKHGNDRQQCQITSYNNENNNETQK